MFKKIHRRPGMFVFLSLVLVAGIVFNSCEEKTKKVLIKTPYGDMKIKLYEDTPEHRENFLKLAEEGFYDDLLFHRVIEEFMVQGGDPDSRDAGENEQLGSGGPGYKLPAEIHYPEHYHKKGALSAARQGDQANPERESSGSQFFIVHGKTYTEEELDQLEEQLGQRQIQSRMFELLEPHRDSLMAMQNRGNREGFKSLVDEVEQEAMEEMGDSAKFTFTEEIRETYTTVGGTPMLDGSYTVFGEVEEGLSVIDSIAGLATNDADRPLEDVPMEVEVIEE
ncbi:MAG: peptidylprolyl isomerase [Marinilabiliaceae bacterium]